MEKELDSHILSEPGEFHQPRVYVLSNLLLCEVSALPDTGGRCVKPRHKVAAAAGSGEPWGALRLGAPAEAFKRFTETGSSFLAKGKAAHQTDRR